MLIGLAVERWAAAHSGDPGTAWWVARGLLTSGHSVEVVTTASGDVPALPGAAIKMVPAQTPSCLERATALRRAASAASALPSVQRDVLDRMGASSDLRSFHPGRYDLLVGVGLRSPHVRSAMTRAVGSTPSVLHLTADDLPVCTMPLLRQSTVGHHLVSHWSELSASLALALRRDVSCVTPSEEAWIPSPDQKNGIGEKPGGLRRYVVWAAAGSAGSEQPAPEPFERVVVDGPTLKSRRLDSLVANASAVVIGFETGDLAALARRSRVPVWIAAGCPGAQWVATTNSGAVVASLTQVAGTLASVLSERTVAPADPGRVVPLQSAEDWARWYVSHV